MTTTEKIGVAVLVVLLFAIELGCVYMGYVMDGWRGAAVLATVLMVQNQIRVLQRRPR